MIEDVLLKVFEIIKMIEYYSMNTVQQPSCRLAMRFARLFNQFRLQINWLINFLLCIINCIEDKETDSYKYAAYILHLPILSSYYRTQKHNSFKITHILYDSLR